LYEYLRKKTDEALKDEQTLKKVITVAIRKHGQPKFEKLVKEALKEMLDRGEDPEKPYPYRLNNMGLVDRAECSLSYEDPDNPPRANRFIFNLDEAEEKKYLEFVKYHEKNCPAEACSGGYFSYHITPTSLGTTFQVQCNVCHKTIDVTNYDDW